MQGNGPLAWLVLGLVSAVLVVLGVFVFQLDNLEERFILQGRQLRALGEATDRAASRLERLTREIQSGGIQIGGTRSGGAAPERDDYAHVQVLHPEVENYLEQDPFTWPAPEANLDGVLSRGWSSGDPKTFNPLLSNDAQVSNLLNAYVLSSVAGRWNFTDPSHWSGDLAWRVEITDDFKEFTIYLREGVKWHTPFAVDLDDPRYAWLGGDHELTASDLVFSLDMLMNPQVENGFAKSYYTDLESWKAVGDYIFVVRWKKKLYGNISQTLGLGPLPEFIYAYEEDGTRIPSETIGLRFNQHWYNNKGLVGTGPYQLVLYQPGEQIRLARFEDYFGDKPAIREMVYPIYTDPKKTLLLLKAHEIDIAALRPGEYREEILKWQDVPAAQRSADSPFLNGELHCEVQDSFGYHYLGWNGNKAIFSDPRVRRAMGLALNRDGIIDNVFVGLGRPATGPLLPSSPYTDPTIEPLDFDLEAARALLAEAGWEDSDGDGLLDKDLGDGTRTPFEFRFLLYSGSPEWASLANIYKEDLRKVGVKMQVDPAEWSLMQKRMDEKEFDVYSGGWLLSWESDLYQLWHSSQADIPRGSNKVGFRNDEADQLMENLRETFDESERIEMFHRLHNLIWESQAYTFFRVAESPICWWNNVKGVVFAKSRPTVNTLPWWVEPRDGR